MLLLSAAPCNGWTVSVIFAGEDPWHSTKAKWNEMRQSSLWSTSDVAVKHPNCRTCSQLQAPSCKETYSPRQKASSSFPVTLGVQHVPHIDAPITSFKCHATNDGPRGHRTGLRGFEDAMHKLSDWTSICWVWWWSWICPYFQPG